MSRAIGEVNDDNFERDVLQVERLLGAVNMGEIARKIDPHMDAH